MMPQALEASVRTARAVRRVRRARAARTAAIERPLTPVCDGAVDQLRAWRYGEDAASSA